MNKTDTVLLCRYIKAMCPAQTIDEYTPDAWADILDDITLEEAKAAIYDGVRDRKWRFIDATDVVAGVRENRRGRLDDYVRKFGPVLPPRELGDKPGEEHEWLVNARRLILDGKVTHPSELGQVDTSVLPVHDVIGTLGQIGREMPRA
jgi:hypothetical protein